MYQKMLLSEKIAETIMSSIKNDFYKIGDQMPNEIQLSEELGVSRATLREAIKILISRNVLEVRRGIGTFVSDTNEYTSQTSNLESLNLYVQKMEILRILKQLDSEELDAFQHLSWSDQTIIRSKIDNIENDSASTAAYISVFFEMVEAIAIARHSTFKHRLILQTHEAFKILISNIVSSDQISIETLIRKLFSTLGNEEVNVVFDELMMQLGFYIQEE